jgi:penicillin-binding protein 2
MNERSRLNMVVVQVLIASIMITLLGRLYYMQVVDGDRYREAALNVQSRDIVTPANRGLIVDNTGLPIAINRAGLEITVDRSIIDKLPDKGSSVLRQVAVILGLDFADVYNRTRLCPELQVGERAGCWNGTRYQPIPITKSATEKQALSILERSDRFPGIDASPISIRFYPSLAGENAAHLLGYVGPVTEKDLNSSGETKFFRNELIGKSGIEYQYDAQLRGVPGVRTVIVDRKEAVTRQSRDLPPVSGNNLVLNINARIQAIAERELAASILRARGQGRRGDSGAAVVMDMQGRVVALASYPTYDPNIWENGITVAQAKRLYSAAAGVPALSRVTQGNFAPASTFKVVSTAAAL